jgi:hypothetical protein
VYAAITPVEIPNTADLAVVKGTDIWPDVVDEPLDMAEPVPAD